MKLKAVGQLCSTASMTHNLAQCRSLVQKAVSVGAKVSFPPSRPLYSLMTSVPRCIWIYLVDASQHIGFIPP